MPGEAVRLSIEDGIERITLARPDSNALDLDMARSLRRAIAGIDHDARVVMIDADGPNFCLGGDLKAFKEAGDAVESYILELTDELHEAILALHELPIPTIASVKGNVAGAGIGLMGACDIAIAAPGSRFTFAYSKVGLTPDGSVSFMLPRTIGRLAYLMAFSQQTVDAGTALRWGLISGIEDQGDPETSAHHIGATIAAGPGRAFRETKRLLRASAERGLPEHLADERTTMAHAAASAEGREGVAAFLEHRSPDYP